MEFAAGQHHVSEWNSPPDNTKPANGIRRLTTPSQRMEFAA